MADNESESQLAVGNESENITAVSFDEAFRELQKNLWDAQNAFHEIEDAGRSGAKHACLAVARFLRVLDQNPLMAAPFFTIRGALDDLDKGVTAELLNRDASDSVRSRSSQKKHLQIMASACLEFLVDKGEPLDQASARVARLVNKWPGIPGSGDPDAGIARRKSRAGSTRPIGALVAGSDSRRAVSLTGVRAPGHDHSSADVDRHL